jgi:hypothetical protein
MRTANEQGRGPPTSEIICEDLCASVVNSEEERNSGIGGFGDSAGTGSRGREFEQKIVLRPGGSSGPEGKGRRGNRPKRAGEEEQRGQGKKDKVKRRGQKKRSCGSIDGRLGDQIAMGLLSPAYLCAGSLITQATWRALSINPSGSRAVGATRMPLVGEVLSTEC